MNYKKINFDNFELYYINTKKFKTINIDTVLINDYDKSNINKEKVISEYIINTSKECINEIDMSKKFMELYEPSIGIIDEFTDVHYKSFNISFLNEKYTEKEMNKKTLDFYFNIIFEPNIINGSFDNNNLNLVKSKLITRSKLQKENSSFCAYYNSIKQIKDNVPSSIDTRLKESLIKKVDSKEACDYYLKEIKKSKVMVFVVGDIDDNFIKLIESNLKNRVYKNDYNWTKRYEVSKVKKEREIIIDTTFNQSILFMFYKIINITDRERQVVLPLFSNILGGSSSKLFNNVREKHSLAYYIHSSSSSIEPIFYIESGIESKNYKKTVELIKEQMNEMIIGNITDTEIENNKESLCSNLLNIDDNGHSIINQLRSSIIGDLYYYEDMKEKYESVSKEELINLGKKIELDFICLSKGVN